LRGIAPFLQRKQKGRNTDERTGSLVKQSQQRKECAV